jgi:methylated-DNA-[protein]-cysteine S-methyltransferase
LRSLALLARPVGYSRSAAAIGDSGVIYVTYLDSPIGRLSLYSDDRALTGLYMDPEEGPRDALPGTDVEPLRAAVRQVSEYFAQQRRDFDLPVVLHGTPFQRRVWRALTQIRYGETWSYGQLAQRIEQPGAARAVGLANGRNPISIVIPCHRVIGADGSLTGYGGGLERKRWLTEHERGTRIDGHKSVNFL